MKNIYEVIKQVKKLKLSFVSKVGIAYSAGIAALTDILKPLGNSTVIGLCLIAGFMLCIIALKLMAYKVTTIKNINDDLEKVSDEKWFIPVFLATLLAFSMFCITYYKNKDAPKGALSENSRVIKDLQDYLLISFATTADYDTLAKLIYNGQVEILDKLYSKSKIDLNKLYKFGSHPILDAIINNRSQCDEVLRWAINNGFRVNQRYSLKNELYSYDNSPKKLIDYLDSLDKSTFLNDIKIWGDEIINKFSFKKEAVTIGDILILNTIHYSENYADLISKYKLDISEGLKLQKSYLESIQSTFDAYYNDVKKSYKPCCEILGKIIVYPINACNYSSAFFDMVKKKPFDFIKALDDSLFLKREYLKLFNPDKTTKIWKLCYTICSDRFESATNKQKINMLNHLDKYSNELIDFEVTNGFYHSLTQFNKKIESYKPRFNKNMKNLFTINKQYAEIYDIANGTINDGE